MNYAAQSRAKVVSMSTTNKINWTPEMDAVIREFWYSRPVDCIGALLGCSGRAVWSHGRKKLGLPPKKLRTLYQPKREALIAAYERHAGPAASFKDIASGSQRRTVCVARWRAFQDILSVPDTRVSAA